jgi:hypothetical protein
MNPKIKAFIFAQLSSEDKYKLLVEAGEGKGPAEQIAFRGGISQFWGSMSLQVRIDTDNYPKLEVWDIVPSIKKYFAFSNLMSKISRNDIQSLLMLAEVPASKAIDMTGDGFLLNDLYNIFKKAPRSIWSGFPARAKDIDFIFGYDEEKPKASVLVVEEQLSSSCASRAPQEVVKQEVAQTKDLVKDIHWPFLTNVQNSDQIASDNQQTCVICMENIPMVVLIPCGHMKFCIKCTKQLEKPECPFCRESVDKAIIAYY